MITFFLILIISFIATLLSSMSGAGSALITIPAWLMLGYSLSTAQAANKVSGTLWTPIAARNYLKSRAVDWKLLSGLGACGLLGAYLGSVFFISVDVKLLQRVIGGIILSLVGLVFVHREFGLTSKAPVTSRLITSVFAVPLGFYEAFFGAGNGIFTSSLLAKTRGLDLVLSLGYYYCISFVWCLFSAVLFLRWGFGDIGLIIPSSIGSFTGAYCGSRIGQRKGVKFVKILFVSLGGLLGLKLLLNV